MFQPNRAILRAEWLSRQFPGAHLYLLRNLDALFASYASFEKGYFFASWLLFIGKNNELPLFRSYAEYKKIEPYEGHIYGKKISAWDWLLQDFDWQDCYDLVAFFWVLALAHATRYADLVINVSDLGSEGKLHDVARQIQDKTGILLELSDFKTSVQPSPGAFRLSFEGVRLIRDGLEIVKPDWSRLPDGVLTSSDRAVLDQVLG